MKQKIFGIIINFNTLRHYIHSNSLLLKKISKRFEEFYLIDSRKLELNLFNSNNKILRWDIDSIIEENEDELFQELPKNFKVIKPLNGEHFKRLFDDKILLLINSIGKTFSEFYLHYLLSSKNIKQVIISNIANNETTIKTKNFKSKIIFYLGKILPSKIISFLRMINFYSKINIRFECNKKLLELFKKSKIKVSYQKIIGVNNRSFDEFKLSKLEISNDYIVLLDTNLNHKEDIIIRGKVNLDDELQHYENLNKLLEKLEALYEKEVIICIHPQYDLEKTKKYFPKYKVFKFKTREMIYKAHLVLFFDTTAIMDAYFLNKKIISLKTKVNMSTDFTRYNKEFGTPLIDINKEFDFNKKNLDEDLLKASSSQNFFLKTYVQIDGENIGIDKILNECQNLVEKTNI
tara:strand:+ start:1646 stop:2860 length:1215 start_codon:yes stop_codon:yes gene_type:complete